MHEHVTKCAGAVRPPLLAIRPERLQGDCRRALRYRTLWPMSWLLQSINRRACLKTRHTPRAAAASCRVDHFGSCSKNGVRRELSWKLIGTAMAAHCIGHCAGAKHTYANMAQGKEAARDTDWVLHARGLQDCDCVNYLISTGDVVWKALSTIAAVTTRRSDCGWPM